MNIWELVYCISITKFSFYFLIKYKLDKRYIYITIWYAHIMLKYMLISNKFSNKNLKYSSDFNYKFYCFYTFASEEMSLVNTHRAFHLRWYFSYKYVLPSTHFKWKAWFLLFYALLVSQIIQFYLYLLPFSVLITILFLFS